VAVAARPLARARATIQLSLPLPSSPEGRAACRSQCGFQPEKEVEMCDLQLMYRECGAETRDDYLRDIANENGLPIACVRKIADRLGEREDFGALILICETRRGRVQ
jgi:hypothetical protein